MLLFLTLGCFLCQEFNKLHQANLKRPERGMKVVGEDVGSVKVLVNLRVIRREVPQYIKY